VIGTAVAAGLSLGLIVFVAWRSYRSGYDMGYRIGREEVLNCRRERELDKAHMHRYGDHIQAGREGRN
jgi:hypothetical protein